MFNVGLTYDYNAADAHRVFRLLFGDCDPDQIGALFGYSFWSVKAWLRGDTPVPVPVYRVCQLIFEGMPPCVGPFQGWSIRHAGGSWRLVRPGDAPESAIRYEDISDWQLIKLERMEARRLSWLVEKQADLIEGLQKAVGWLRKQVTLEARMGLMLRRISMDDPPPDVDRRVR